MIYDNFLFFLKNPSSTAKTQNPAVFIIKSERPFIFLKIKTLIINQLNTTIRIHHKKVYFFSGLIKIYALYLQP